jgi:threonine synthase
MTLAKERGLRGWIATSSGNAGMALAAYGARAGLPGILFTLPSIPREKLMPLLGLGVRLHMIEGLGAGASRTVEEAMFAAVSASAERFGLFLGVTAHKFNGDGMRGVDTLGYELHEEAPNIRAVYVPTGGGGLAAATGRGLADAGSKAALVICQPTGCAPIAAFLNGEIDMPRVDRCDTRVSGLQLPSPPDGMLSADIARASGGWGSHADDEAAGAARLRLARTEGVFVEPASAVALACAIKDRESGRLSTEDRVVLVLTGSGLKELKSIEDSVSPPTRIAPDAIEAQVQDLFG